MNARVARLSLAVGILLSLFGLSQALSASQDATAGANKKAAKKSKSVKVCADEVTGVIRLPKGGGRCREDERGFRLGRKGARGRAGKRGAKGAAGLSGSAGPQGPTGQTGSIGPPGPPGPAFASAYGYFFGDQLEIVAPSGTISLGNSTAQGLSLAAGNVTVLVAGVYLISYVLTTDASGPYEAALSVNGVPVPGSTYAVAAGNTQINGQLSVSLQAGDIVFLQNVGSGNMTLDNSVGAGINVSASLTMTRIAD